MIACVLDFRLCGVVSQSENCHYPSSAESQDKKENEAKLVHKAYSHDIVFKVAIVHC